VSTILDALRKLQREKTAANPSRDLRGSVTDEIRSPPTRGSPPRRGLAFGALLLALLVVAGVGGTWLYRRSAAARANSPPAQQVAEPLAPAEPPAAQDEAGDEGQPATEAELDAMQREMEMDAATAPDAADAPPPVAASPEPQAPPAPAQKDAPPTPEAEAAVERARLEETRRAAAAAEQARRDAEASAQADAAAAASAMPPVAPLAVPPPAPPPALAAPPVPAAKASRPVAAAKPAAKPKPKAAAPPPETASREPEPDSDAANDALAVFPAVRVESIRWHPLPERRAASLRFDQQNAADAHEGDIVGGVLVYRIEPGAVELRVGSTSRVVRPTP